MRADKYIRFAEIFFDQGRGYQAYPYLKSVKDFVKSIKVLICQNLRRSHKNCLIAVDKRCEGSRRGNHRFSRADITFKESVHGRIFEKIFVDFIYRPDLGIG